MASRPSLDVKRLAQQLEALEKETAAVEAIAAGQAELLQKTVVGKGWRAWTGGGALLGLLAAATAALPVESLIAHTIPCRFRNPSRSYMPMGATLDRAFLPPPRSEKQKP
jgi:hypothetical protein